MASHKYRQQMRERTRDVNNHFYNLGVLGSGTYGVVYKVRSGALGMQDAAATTRRATSESQPRPHDS